MDELINKISNQLGLEVSVVRQALGAILCYLKEHSASYDFEGHISKGIQGVESLMKESSKAQKEARSGSSESSTTNHPTGIFGLVFHLLTVFGVLALLKKLLQPFLGESAVKLIEQVEDGAELVAVLQKLGIDREKGVSMVQMLVAFCKDKLGPDTIEDLMEQVPAVKAFLGEAKKEE
jgi:hypothetical protein